MRDRLIVEVEVKLDGSWLCIDSRLIFLEISFHNFIRLFYNLFTTSLLVSILILVNEYKTKHNNMYVLFLQFFYVNYV